MVEASRNLLNDLLAYPVAALGRPMENHASWLKSWESDGSRGRTPIERSIFGGFLSDRLAWAFTSGYQGAIRQLIPDLLEGTLAAICITESGGNHPRAIAARLTENASTGALMLSGEKTFVTNGLVADLLVVAASTGLSGGRNRIRMVTVERSDRGLDVAPMPPLPFIREITHCRARFNSVTIPSAHLLPGDGYRNYVKPFRTIEDLHVAGALLGYFLGVGRRFRWPEAVSAQAIALIALATALARQDPTAPHLHIAVDGLLRHLEILTTRISSLWQQVPPEIVTRWHRDKAILTVASKPREMRFASAWECYQ